MRVEGRDQDRSKDVKPLELSRCLWIGQNAKGKLDYYEKDLET
jgi:hypothetical protein